MGNTDKKNQHYIPKFYLRNFSYEGNGKQIGIYNINNKLFVERAKLKTQGSKNFFYGTDGKIEDGLSNIEGELAKIIRNTIDTKSLPQKDTPEHFTLLVFVALTELRNPVRIENTKGMFSKMKSLIEEIHPKVDSKELSPLILSNEEAINMSLANVVEMSHNIEDLDFKLLLNETNRPFITSDFPVVKYNQFLEQRKWIHGKCGFGVTGLQIFIPLNSRMLLIFFDSGIYKVGDRQQKIYTIKKDKDVDQINNLQFVNCFDTLYFDEYVSEQYIYKLHLQSQRFKRANETTSEVSYLFKDRKDREEVLRTGKKNLVIMGTTDCETKLSIDGIKIHSRGKIQEFHPSMAQLRPHALRLTQLRRPTINS